LSFSFAIISSFCVVIPINIYHVMTGTLTRLYRQQSPRFNSELGPSPTYAPPHASIEVLAMCRHLSFCQCKTRWTTTKFSEVCQSPKSSKLRDA
jgi:hypothetical protein